MNELLVLLPEELAEDILEAGEGRLASPSRDAFSGSPLGVVVDVINSGASVVTVAVAVSSLPKIARRIVSAIRQRRSNGTVTITISRPGKPREELVVSEEDPRAPELVDAFFQSNLVFPGDK